MENVIKDTGKDVKLTKTGGIGIPEMNFNTTDIIFALVMLACGFLYWNLRWTGVPGAGVTIFAAIMIGASFVYMSKSGLRQNAKSLTYLTLAILSAVWFAVFDNQALHFLNFLFLSAMFIYWICVSTGRELDKKLSVYAIGDAFKQAVNMPFNNFSCCFEGIAKGFAAQKKAKWLIPAIVGLIIFAPLIAIVVSLLMSADLAFESFMWGLVARLNIFRVFEYGIQFALGVPVAFYMYGLVYGNIKGRYDGNITAKSVDNAAKAVKIAPKATIYSVLTAFNIIYLIFFAVQIEYLFSAFNSNLPGTFTYAEFARRGFFELCKVAGINLGLLAVAHLSIKREMSEEPKILRIQTTIISLFTMLLIVTALSKMLMYINVFGLTQLRLVTSWFMILLFFIFAAICVRQFKKFNSAKVIIIGFIFMFMTLSYSNVDGLIARYNIQRYEAGTLQMLDINALQGLSSAAVPHIWELYLRTDESNVRRQEQLAQAIMWAGSTSRARGFRGFNIQNHRADEIRENFVFNSLTHTWSLQGSLQQKRGNS